MVSKDIKAPTDDAVNQLERRLQTDGFSKGASGLDRMELAGQMVTSLAAGQSDDGNNVGESAFSSASKEMARVPNIGSMKSLSA